MELNPIANASLEVAKDFTNLVLNVSSSFTKPTYAAAWKAAQKVRNFISIIISRLIIMLRCNYLYAVQLQLTMMCFVKNDKRPIC